MAPTAGPGAYDAVAYPSVPYPAAHPDRLATVAHLHGLQTADPERCRYLDLACGDGGNLLAVAAALPDARCAGLDASREAIERGLGLRDAAGLEHVELRVADLLDPEAADGLAPADFIVLHGLASWVADDVRDAALALASRSLAEGGVLFVSYNALPGWHLLRPARALSRRHAARAPLDAQLRADAARQALSKARELHAADDAYSAALGMAEERYALAHPATLFHDDLAEICTPLLLEEVAAAAGRHGLRYLAEALPDQWWAHRLAPAATARLLEGVPADALSRQQEADYASGATFKATLFVAEAAEIDGEIDPDRALDLHAAATPDPPDPGPGTSPAAAATFAALAAAAPAAVPVRALAERAELGPEATARAVLRLAAERRATLHLRAPRFATEPGPRPQATPLARAQAGAGLPVATLRHDSVDFAQPQGRALLQLLDGSRDRDALADQLGLDQAACGAALDELAHRALLLPTPAGARR